MIRAFKLEWLKVKNYRVFWILFGLYLLVQLFITNGGIFVLQWLESKGADFDGIKPSIIPIYDFPDIWQNSVWLASFPKVLVSFIVVVSVNNELTYNTLRQNVIDGISKKEFLLSKFSLIIFLAGICTIVLFLSGLAAGFTYSHVTDVKYIFQDLEFLLAYFLQLVAFCLFAFCIALMIKKGGFAIVGIIIYSIFQLIFTSILEFSPYTKDTVGHFVKFLPIYSIESLTGKIYKSPFARYLLQEIQTDVLWYQWAIVIAWIGIFSLIITYILNKKDLKA